MICASCDTSSFRWTSYEHKRQYDFVKNKCRETTIGASSRRCLWIMSINTGVILKIMNIAKTTTRASSRRVARARLLGRLDGGSRHCSSSSAMSSEDQICDNDGYDRVFGALLWLFSLCCSRHESRLNLSFHGHRLYRFRRDNRGCRGPVLDHLQPIPGSIPDAAYLPCS